MSIINTICWSKVGHSGGFQKRKSEKSLRRNNFSDLVSNLAFCQLAVPCVRLGANACVAHRPRRNKSARSSCLRQRSLIYSHSTWYKWLLPYIVLFPIQIHLILIYYTIYHDFSILNWSGIGHEFWVKFVLF